MFDPFGAAERFLPPRILHRLIRWGMAGIFGVFTILRVHEYPRYASKPLWAVETVLFLVFAGAYAGRKDPVDRARGAEEVLLPLGASAAPFLLLFFPPHPLFAHRGDLRDLVFVALCLGTGFTLWALWNLRRAFSIATEARELVTSGPYGRVRHPMYAGELFSAGVVTVWRLSPGALGVFLLFGILQLLRSRREELKLLRVFGEAYRRSASRAWWFWDV